MALDTVDKPKAQRPGREAEDCGVRARHPVGGDLWAEAALPVIEMRRCARTSIH